MTSRKTLLFILQRAPHGSSALREALDAALAAAAFEQRVQLLFSGDGVFALLPNQQVDAIHSKDTSKMLQALQYYDIDEVFFDAISLAERNIDAATLAIPAQAAGAEQLRELMHNADSVVAL